MSFGDRAAKARAGDRIEVRELRGRTVRLGLIVELLGDPDSVHFLARWNEDHESIVFPCRNARVLPRGRQATLRH